MINQNYRWLHDPNHHIFLLHFDQNSVCWKQHELTRHVKFRKIIYSLLTLSICFALPKQHIKEHPVSLDNWVLHSLFSDWTSRFHLHQNGSIPPACQEPWILYLSLMRMYHEATCWTSLHPPPQPPLFNFAVSTSVISTTARNRTGSTLRESKTP